MLNLFDYLTPLDNKRIENYIHLYGINKDDYIGNETYLKYWAENKKHLFHLLGGKLIYKFPIKFVRPKIQMAQDFKKLNTFISLFYDKIDSEKYHEQVPSALMRQKVRELTWTETFLEDQVPGTIKVKLENKPKMLQIQRGMKPVKAIQKIIEYFDWDDLKEPFEDFRLKHSQICNTREMTGNLCISIHPLDFMTMSDNDSGWSSCMTWTSKGCYHEGTVEMMNSNNVVCCYIESADPYYFGTEKTEEYAWNNKKWRQLFYITKEIAVCGKAYPYQYKAFTVAILDKIKELTEENLHRTYQFGIEPYRDMTHIGSLFRMENNQKWIHERRTRKHNIIFHSKGMYNDMFNDHDGDEDIYWCYRNKVKKNTIICYSGKAPCLCCGNAVLEKRDLCGDYYEGDYNDRYENTNNVLCQECIDDFRCDSCDETHPTEKLHLISGKRYCEKCYRSYVKKCPSCGKPFLARSNFSYQSFLWGRVSEAELYQQDFYHSSGAFADGPAIALWMCDDCHQKKRENFVKIIPPYDEDRPYYPWISKKEFFVSKDLIEKDSPEWSKYFYENLVAFKEA